MAEVKSELQLFYGFHLYFEDKSTGFQRIDMYRMIVLFLIFFISSSRYVDAAIVTEYQRTYVPVYTKNGDFSIAIRAFNLNQVPSFLIVDTKTLKTEVIPVTNVYLKSDKNKTKGYTEWKIESTRYAQLLNHYTAPPYTLENYGVVNANKNVQGVILSIDLCPSSKPFEKKLFDRLAALSHDEPIPVALSISGLWLLMHQSEFQYLLSLQKEKKLAITWVNHSFSHPYFSDLPDKKNFLLAKTVNMESEILLTEQYLVENNQVPSVFFRFPGLVSNEKVVRQLKEYGLIPLGADAWLAKNQHPRNGSIILIHGNGNEPDGVKALLKNLKKYHFIGVNQSI